MIHFDPKRAYIGLPYSKAKIGELCAMDPKKIQVDYENKIVYIELQGVFMVKE